MSDQAPGAVPYPRRPWLTIWTRPRETIRAIADSNPKRHVLWLVIVAAFVTGLSRAANDAQGDDLDVWTILAIAAGVGAVSGAVCLYLLGWLTRWSGRWLGGTASAPQLRAALAWPTIAWVALGVIWIPELAIYGHEMFTSKSVSLVLYGVLWINFVLSVIATLSMAVLTAICLSEVQGFSVWRAVLNSAIAIFLLVAPLQLFLWLFSGRDL